MNLNSTGFLTKIPVVTLYFTGILITTTILISLKVLNPAYIILNWIFVYKSRQIWRIFTNYFFIGSFSMSWIMSLAVFIQFSSSLENSLVFSRSRGAYLYFIFLQMVTISTLSILFYWPIGYPILFESLYMSIVYYWSRMEKMTPISIYFITVNGYQLPILLCIFHLLTGGSILNDLMGLLAGHLYHYIRDLVPNGSQLCFIKTPIFFDNIVLKMNVFVNYLSNYHLNSNNQTNRGGFRGRGVALNS